MDKNFVNIDDLVRQRLEGREEQEPPGAWLRMRELLDEEMPRRRGAFVYWRRFFNVTAIALMTTSIGIGVYHLATSSHGGPNGLAAAETAIVEPGATNGELPAAVAVQATTAQTPAAVAMRNDAAGETTGSAATTAGNPSISVMRNSEYRRHLTDTHANVRARNNDALLKMLAQNGIDLNKKNSDADNTPAPDRQLLAMNEKFNSYNDNHYKAIVTGTSVNARNAEVKVSDAPVASASTSNAHAPHTAIATYRRIAGNAKHSAVASSETTVRTQHTAGSNGTETVQSVATTSGSHTPATDRHHSRIGSNRRAGSKDGNIVPASGSVASASVPVKPGQQLRNHTTTSGSNEAANAERTSAVAATSVNKIPTGNSVPVSGLPVASSGVSAINTLPKDAQPATQDAMQQASVANISKGKKVMEKMVLFEHYIKTTPSEGYYKMDTISYETFTRDNNKITSDNIALADAAQPAEQPNPAGKVAGTNGTIAGKASNTSGAGSKGHKKGAKGQNATGTVLAANTSAANGGAGNTSSAARNLNAEETSGEENVNNENVLASAAGSTAAAKPGLLANEQSKAKKNNTGFSATEKLAQTFNDVKMKALGARFVPGLTAGISSTFFGPASFKGFHFGVTGTLVFDDIVSLQAELKYFHRINSNFAIDDNYYTYTPVGSGQFAKQQENNSYGFSSLQSIEMPISLRYRRGNFTIFAGANLVYTFAINTGAATLPSNTAPVLVSAQGSDNQPKLSERDFESRFGVGYLFGFAYEISPNVTLDLRSVQTIWDNAGTSGARSISSQLYKNPSVQLSFGYKFVKRNK